MKGSSSVFLLFIAFMQLTLAYGMKASDYLQGMPKGDIKPGWEDLGWGKRSAVGELSYPRRFLRSMQLVKKSVDWHSLGWAWGRRK
ncbi:hypothetical protein V3C99_014923 [Haemonchus contortus]